MGVKEREGKNCETPSPGGRLETWDRHMNRITPWPTTYSPQPPCLLHYTPRKVPRQEIQGRPALAWPTWRCESCKPPSARGPTTVTEPPERATRSRMVPGESLCVMVAKEKGWNWEEGRKASLLAAACSANSYIVSRPPLNRGEATPG